MEIKVFYQSGKIDIFTSADFASKEPWAHRGVNLMTEFTPRLDLLEQEGLIVDTFWYDGADEDDTVECVDVDSDTVLKHAVRRTGRRVLLVSKAELGKIAQIMIGGDLVAWRQGEFLINGTKFRNQEILCFSNDNVTSINRRASAVFAYLKKAYPDASEEELSNRMGFPLEAIRQIQEAEDANIDEDDDEDWD